MIAARDDLWSPAALPDVLDCAGLELCLTGLEIGTEDVHGAVGGKVEETCADGVLATTVNET